MLLLKTKPNGDLRPLWYGRFRLDGKIRETPLCRWKGKPPASEKAYDKGDQSFEDSRKKAETMLEEFIEGRRSEADKTAMIERIYRAKYEKRAPREKRRQTFGAVKIADLYQVWRGIPRSKSPTAGRDAVARNIFSRFADYLKREAPRTTETAALRKEHIDGYLKEIEAEGVSEVRVRVLDATDDEVASATGAQGRIEVPHAQLWAPGDGYLYTLEICADADVYPQPFGIRTVEIKDKKFLINGKEFYFRGYGRHEDNLVRGKGHDDVMMVHDFELMKWQGANSFRTSHYPYAEEVMDFADREGVVVIDETAAVGLNTALWGGGGLMGGVGLPPTFSPGTINDATRDVHQAHIRELIARDKNHPCVAVWSIANEPDSGADGAREYFAPLIQAARDADPTRPVGSRSTTSHQWCPQADIPPRPWSAKWFRSARPSGAKVTTPSPQAWWCGITAPSTRSSPTPRRAPHRCRPRRGPRSSRPGCPWPRVSLPTCSTASSPPTPSACGRTGSTAGAIRSRRGDTPSPSSSKPARARPN